jgi:cupin superfamily acireductone dioxygenase involved in methionine salvage
LCFIAVNSTAKKSGKTNQSRMAETAAWFFVWIPKKEEEIRLIQEEKVKKKKAEEELKKQEEENRKLEEEQAKLEEEKRLKEEELAKKVIDGLNEGQTDLNTENDWPEVKLTIYKNTLMLTPLGIQDWFSITHDLSSLTTNTFCLLVSIKQYGFNLPVLSVS